MTTSVIIPCYYGHIFHLDSLLDSLSAQTRVPDEVVISISEVDKADRNALLELQNKATPFLTKIITHPEKRWSGYNRNSACSHASGEILICQDADDIPHLQRIETISYFFETYQIDLLLHKWVPIEETDLFFTTFYQKEKIPFFFITKPTQLKHSGPIHHGNNAISAKVFKKFKWNNLPQGEDYLFNRSVIQEFRKSVIIDAGLLLYRFQLSSFADKI